MDLLTTGAFAQASGLTRKALRLYDDLGLLRPAVVGESTGYRYYRRDQLAQATLVAWLHCPSRNGPSASRSSPSWMASLTELLAAQSRSATAVPGPRDSATRA